MPRADDTTTDATVYVVDDDAAIRHAMQLLLQSVALPCRIYAGGRELLDDLPPDSAGCVVLDIRMPDIGGLELQRQLRAAGCALPILFITGYGDVPMAVEAMQDGAFDFIEKPFRDQDLLDRIAAAIAADRSSREERDEARDINDRLARLTKREREVYECVVAGKQNKVIAWELGVSQRTVEIHRARVMEKMEARSLADLVRMDMARLAS